jgi:hypothetical protein
MLASAAAAFVLPFETFLLAYAVLGPLHYLTQISWLHDRQYFTQQQHDWVPLLVVAVVVTAFSLLAVGYPAWQAAATWSPDLMLWCLVWGLLVVVTKDRVLRVAGAVVAGAAVLLLHGQSPSTVFAMLWLPTLVHVFGFTGLFVLYGTLKSRSGTGWLSLLVFFGCAALVLWLPIGNLGYEASGYVHDAYQGTMGQMHVRLLNTSGLGAAAVSGAASSGTWAPFPSLAAMLQNDVSVQLGRFIGFAYTYHYLNWFSKTSVIRWHQVPRSRLLAAVVIWIGSVALYFVDYEKGLRWLFLLSLLHVVLEFPLDWKTLLAIPRELRPRRAAT